MTLERIVGLVMLLCAFTLMAYQSPCELPDGSLTEVCKP